MRAFSFHNPGKLVFGKKASRNAGAELLALGARRPLLVTDEALIKTEIVETVKKPLEAALAGVFSDVAPDTGFEIIAAAVAMARKVGADSVISVGGGSSIDTGKAVAAVLGTGVESVKELIGFYKLTKRPAPHLAIPTTAGTGSEVTSMAVIKDRAAGRKLLLLDPKLIPEVGILDPLLTLGLPPAITAATGMDALTHAAEALMSRNAQPPTDALALHALALIAQNLPQAALHGDDVEARSFMLVASAEAGMAFQNAYVGVVHAMAHALGGIFGVPHGLANGLLLWAGAEYNAKEVPARVAMIGKAMGIKESGTPEEDAARTVEMLREFTKKIGLPSKLTDVGVDPSRLSEVAALALADAAFLSNLRKTEDPGEIEAILRKCL